MPLQSLSPKRSENPARAGVQKHNTVARCGLTRGGNRRAPGESREEPAGRVPHRSGSWHDARQEPGPAEKHARWERSYPHGKAALGRTSHNWSCGGGGWQTGTEGRRTHGGGCSAALAACRKGRRPDVAWREEGPPQLPTRTKTRRRGGPQIPAATKKSFRSGPRPGRRRARGVRRSGAGGGAQSAAAACQTVVDTLSDGVAALPDAEHLVGFGGHPRKA
ncbi:hypothetical protein MTO96_001370 [Rhipicephalus appendiculatus]